MKELAHSVVVHTFLTRQKIYTVDETIQWQHLDQYVNIYLHRECCKTSFICCFTVTTENLI